MVKGCFVLIIFILPLGNYFENIQYHIPELPCFQLHLTFLKRCLGTFEVPYEGRQKCLLAKKDSFTECVQLRFIFQQGFSYILHRSSIGVVKLGSHW